MVNLRLIERKVDKNPIFSRKFEVKEGRRIFAKIYQRVNCEYSVEINGVTWIKNDLFDAIDHVNEMAGLLFFQNVEIIKINPDLMGSEKTSKLTFEDAKKRGIVENLIPVHINKCRCENYFWDWSSNTGDWVRGEKIPEKLKQAYQNPMPIEKSSYK